MVQVGKKPPGNFNIQGDNAIPNIVVFFSFDRLTSVIFHVASISKKNVQFAEVKRERQETEIRKYFRKFGTVVMVELKKGEGVVAFSLPEEANKAMQKTVHIVGTSKLYIYI